MSLDFEPCAIGIISWRNRWYSLPMSAGDRLGVLTYLLSGSQYLPKTLCRASARQRNSGSAFTSPSSKKGARGNYDSCKLSSELNGASFPGY
jgi:hypothetical protein